MGKLRSNIGWGVSASILLHVVFAGVIFLHLPLDFSEPPEEEAVQVELVPPPEEEKAKEEEQAQEAPPQQPETKEEPAAPPPPPPPPPPSPQAETVPEQPLQALRPVFEFGEEDSGPRRSADGDASEEPAPPPKAPTEAKVEAEAPDEEVAQGEDVPQPAEENAAPLPDGINLPEVDAAETSPERDGAPAAGEVSLETVPVPATRPKPEKTAEVSNDKPVELKEAKRLYSQSETGGELARTAMRNLPRDLRVSQLCTTELQAQLRHASPAYLPEVLPSYRLPEGTVLDVRGAAFRADAKWYDVSFRCEIDGNATKVVSFAFEVGNPVPRSEWRRRGFPIF